MDRSAFASPLALSSFILAVGTAGCLNRASFEADMKSAPVSQNPFAAGPELAQAPPTVNNRQGDSFRITLADRKEVCVSGQTSDSAARVKSSTFILESFSSPNDLARVGVAKSKSIKIIQDTERSTNRGTVEPVTVFEACFANTGVFTADTEYLTMQPEMQHVANKLFVAWHFTKEAVQVKHEFQPGHSWDSRTSPSVEALHRMPQAPLESQRFEGAAVNPYARVSPSSF